MAYKILGQAAPTNTSNMDLYTVPALSSAVVSTVMVSNTTATLATCRIFAVPSGGSASSSNAIVFDGPIEGNDFKAITVGITLAQGDKLVVQSGTSEALTFQAFGSEVSN